MSTSQGAAPETELKFELGADAYCALAEHPLFASPDRRKHLRSIYFDTPGHDLRNGGFSLRVRGGDEGFVQTIKRREGARLFERQEWEAPVVAASPDLGALERTPAGALLNGEAELLEPVFATTVARTVQLWRDGDTVIELSLDDGEVAVGPHREPIRELELELKAGEPAQLFALARELAGSAGMTLSFDTKGERGYRLAGHDGLAAVKAERARIAPATAAADAFRIVVRGCLAQISGNAQLLRRVRRPETLHQLRIGLRRLRASLSAFRPMLRDDRYGWVRAETKWLAGELDQARDLDAFTQGVFRRGEDAVDGDAAAALGRRLLHAQAQAYDRATAALESPRFAGFLLETAAWAEVGEWSRCEEAAPARARPAGKFGAEALARLRGKLLKAGGDFERLDAAGRRRLRNRAETLRHAAEMFAEALPGPRLRRRGPFLRRLKDLQERLGELHDIAVARDRAIEFIGPRSTDLAFTAGLIVGRREQQEAALAAAARSAYAELAQAKPFWKALGPRA